jgi:hypothetical protein
MQESGSATVQTVVNLVSAGAGIAGTAFKESENLGIDSKVKAIDTKSTAAPINTDLKNYTGRYKDIVDYQKPENANAKGETFHSGNLNMDINVKIPSGMDQRAFDELMRTPEFREALLKMINDAPKENNQSKVPGQR